MTPSKKKHTIVFLHGSGVTSAWWLPQITVLQQDYQIIAPDLAGHGGEADRPFILDQVVEELAVDIHASGGGPALLVGVSLGGYVAMAFGARHPELTSGLVLSGCSMNLSGFAGLGFRLTSLFLKIRGIEWLEEGTIKGFRKRIPPERLDPILERGLYLETATKSFSELARLNYHRLVADYPHPVLILNGEGDEPNRPHEQKLLAALQKGSLVILENAGHLANQEQPEAFNAAILGFAKKASWSNSGSSM